MDKPMIILYLLGENKEKLFELNHGRQLSVTELTNVTLNKSTMAEDAE